MICERCGGVGRIHEQQDFAPGIVTGMIYTCPDCDGTGMRGSCEGDPMPQPEEPKESDK